MRKTRIVLMSLLTVFLLAGCGNSPDPCECGDLWGKKLMIGYGSLSSSDQEKYNNCVDAYDTNANTVDACVDKVIEEGEY